MHSRASIIAQGSPSQSELREPPRTQLAPALEECLAVADKRMAQALASPTSEGLANELVTEKAKLALAWNLERPFTPKELADALDCPFKFFARRLLRLNSGRSVRRWSSLRHLPQAASLHKQATPADAEAALHVALETEMETMLTEVAPWEMATLRETMNLEIQM